MTDETFAKRTKKAFSRLMDILGGADTKGTDTYHYENFDIPVGLIHLTGGGPDTFDAISRMHMKNLVEFIGIGPEDSVLEIGCGIGRDAIPLTKVLSTEGRYLGIDIIRPSIEWCKRNITPRYPNFNFVHFDIKDQLHNPQGTIGMQDIRIPLASGTVDLVFLQSVFTHLMREDILVYLKEFRRLLKPSGHIYATMFIVNDMILASARSTNLTPWSLRFEHRMGNGCLINDPLNPTGAVAYTYDALLEMLAEAGLRLTRPLLKGSWSGYYTDPDDGQDVAIMATGLG